MKRTEKLIAAILGFGLFGAIAVGATLALYQTEKTVNNHLSSGGMDASLYLLELKNDVLENDGTITNDVPAELEDYTGYVESIEYVDMDTSEEKSHEGVDLSEYSDEVFAVDHIVPTMQGSATFLIKNDAATDAADSVAFAFSVSLSTPEGDPELIEQVEIELVNADWEGNPVLSGYGKVFQVCWEFKDLEENNDAMDQSLTFDISVVCTQIVRE